MQVQDSLKDIIKQTVGQKNLSTHLITYADNAKIIDFDKNNYNQVIDGTNAGGMTNFKSAFVKLCKVMDESGEKINYFYLSCSFVILADFREIKKALP